MAVGAYPLQLPSLPSQILSPREMMMDGGWACGGVGGGVDVSTAAAAIWPFYSQSESGVTTSMATTTGSRKRSREAMAMPSPAAAPVSLFGEDLSLLLQQQLLDVDRVVIAHMERVRAELTERRRRFTAAVEAAVARRLLAKNEEIERLAKHSAQLDERAKALRAEIQIWRDFAQCNAAEVTTLRFELERAVAAAAAQQAAADDNLDAASDAGSCCGEGEDRLQRGADAAAPPARLCRGCGEAEASVLLLPCRHLCACAACAVTVAACPACGVIKNGTVNVNLI